jgi:ATP synthase protein I
VAGKKAWGPGIGDFMGEARTRTRAACDEVKEKAMIGFEPEASARRERKLRARKEKDRGLWFGLGTFGVIGWAVAVPTLVGTGIGLWLDALEVGGAASWTLALTVAGVILGCVNAWYWIRRERAAMFPEGKGKKDD